MSSSSSVKDRLNYRAYALGWGIVKRLPERTAYRLFERAADRVWAKRGKGVTQLERNLARVLGPDVPAQRLREVSKEGMRTYLRYWCDTFRLETWSRERIDSTFLIENTHYIDEAVATGTGIVLALPHMGNWDHAGAWATGQYKTFTTVAERLKPERLFDRFVAYRESIGMEVLPLTGGQGTFIGLVRRIKSGGLVCLVAERDLTSSGVPVTFFGETTKLPAGPAALALATRAPLHGVTLWYDGDVQRAIIHPPLTAPNGATTREEKIASLCQQLADVFAGGIAEHPGHWHMLQKLWLADLDPAKAPVASSTPASVEA